MTPELMELARKACKTACRSGAEFVDVQLDRRRSISINAEKNGIHDCSAKAYAGVSVRSIIKGATGFSSSSGLDEKKALATARRSVAIARFAQPDPDFIALPEPSAYQDVPGLYDEKVDRMDVGELIRIFSSELDAAREVFPEVRVQGNAGLETGERVLVNSSGIEVCEPATSIWLHVFCIAKKRDAIGSFMDFDSARALADFAPQGLGAKTCREAVSFLGARSMKSAVLPVVFGPLVTRNIFYALCAGAEADGIQRKRSYLAGKRGTQIGSKLLTLTDNAYIPGGLASGPCDGEGAARKTVTVVQEGVLLNHLHSSYTARKSREANTGHGNRWGGISPTNVVPKLGAEPASAIIRDTREGIYVNMGSVSPDRVHGEISASIDFGYKIENGKLAYPLKNTMLGINILDLLKNLDAVSSDYREEPGMIMPTIRVQNIKVAGAV